MICPNDDDPLPFNGDISKEEYNSLVISQAMAVLRKAMKEDTAYAFGWHSNIAMAVHDAIIDNVDSDDENCYEKSAKTIGNEAASRFMKSCFDIETSQDMLTK